MNLKKNIFGFLSLLIFIFSCGDLYNKQNEILSISAAADSIEGGSTVGLYCNATDQDGDKLSYYWEAASGELITNGDSAYWTAPMDRGVYFITCTVSDEYGASSVESIGITVLKPNNSPYLNISSSEPEIKIGQSVELISQAGDDDDDELSYLWTCSSGSIDNPTNPFPLWTAPMDTGNYDINCTVTDPYGATASDSISVYVISVVPVNGLIWTLTDGGLIGGTNSSNENNTGINGYWDGTVDNADFGWNVTTQQATENSISQSLQFKVEDSENCGGSNANTQTGRAIANIEITGTDVVTLEIDFSGVGEAQSAGYDLIEFNLNGVVIGNGEAPGGGLGCEAAPVIVNPAVPQSLAPGPHTLIIDFTTNDALYHVNAYYEIALTLTAP